jgi:hypothetical protein
MQLYFINVIDCREGGSLKWFVVVQVVWWAIQGTVLVHYTVKTCINSDLQHWVWIVLYGGALCCIFRYTFSLMIVYIVSSVVP